MRSYRPEITKLQIAEKLVAGTRQSIKNGMEQKAVAQITMMMKYPNMSAKQLGKKLGLSENLVRKFRRMKKDYRII